ncbi:MAG: phospholipase D-like domain-containing protein [Vulcanimicrobiaceae bacterium]
MITLSSTGELLAALRSASTIEFSAYVLSGGRVRNALEDACRRGAHVVARFDGDPYGDPNASLAKMNAATVRKLVELGADAKLVHASDADGPSLHLKAAICDDAVYLDDRNWPSSGDDTIVRDTDAADVEAIHDTLSGVPAPPSSSFCTSKASALHAEADLLRSAEHARSVDVESESFGKGSGVYGALQQLAQAGVHCRLLVDEKERKQSAAEDGALRRLAGEGVDVRVGRFEEKFAVVDGARAWVGSANATTAYYDGDQVEWGLRTDAAGVANVLEQRFDAHWAEAKPL